MSEEFLADASVWRVEYTDESIHPLARELARIAGVDGAGSGEPRRLPASAVLGTPTVILTIVVTTLSKSIVVAGLRMLQQKLKDRIAAKEAENIEIKLVDETAKQRKKFMTEISKEAIDLMFSKAIKFVEAI